MNAVGHQDFAEETCSWQAYVEIEVIEDHLDGKIKGIQT